MSVDTFLNFISVIIAAIDIGIVIYDRLNANNQSYIISKVEAPTVNIFIQNNPTTNGPTFQTSREHSEATQRDYSQYAKFFFVFILILGFALQTHFRVFIILLSISTILSLTSPTVGTPWDSWQAVRLRTFLPQNWQACLKG